MSVPAINIWFERTDQGRLIGCYEGMGGKGWMPAEQMEAFADAQVSREIAVTWFMRALWLEDGVRIMLTTQGQRATDSTGKLRFLPADTSLFELESLEEADGPRDQQSDAYRPTDAGPRVKADAQRNQRVQSLHRYPRYLEDEGWTETRED